MISDFPLTQDLVLIGGGHAHALVLRQWGMKPLAGARLTVINPGPTAPYSGMLPGFVAGHYTRDDLDIDLVRLCRFAGARLIDGAVTGIDRHAQLIHVPGRPPIAYDVASIDIGITSAMPALPGFADHAIPAKPLGHFASQWDAFRTKAKTPTVAVIGGGVAGAELALAMRHALADRQPTVHLIDRSQVLAALGSKARHKMLAALAAQDVQVHENAEITRITPAQVHLADGTFIDASFITGAAGAWPHPWMADVGVEMHNGFIAVDAFLQSTDPNLFAVGDCAHMTENPRAKAGVYAVRQAPILYDNLQAVLSGGKRRKYQPQSDYLKLISLGRRSALAERFGTAMAGPLLWRWKDHIDRTFMDRLNDLPAMKTADLPPVHAKGLAEIDKVMCGGCGAKVGRGALRGGLAVLPATPRDDVQVLPGDDAAVLHTGGARQVLTTDHLRAFVKDPVLMTRIAATHALGDVWAMGAAPQAATVNLILPRMSSALQERTLSEVMETAQQVLAAAGCAIVGGHTSLGAEMTIGFSITGLCDRDPITLSGARPGDALILTKPIGGGVIMAADMAGRARGADVMAALTLMAQAQGVAAGILANARAMTDITGFGLGGHLSGLCAASGVGATISLAELPVMTGAENLASQGVQSSLFADNLAGAVGVNGPQSARYDLLFDPQTAGGLLAAVPGNQADGLCKKLQDAGYPDSVIIGHITSEAGVITARA